MRILLDILSGILYLIITMLIILVMAIVWYFAIIIAVFNEVITYIRRNIR
jgi:hypothetical protein